jgi:hypothetical protein
MIRRPTRSFHCCHAAGVSPLLPFFVWTPAAAAVNPVAVAVAKFRHLPYDTIAVVASRPVGGGARFRSSPSRTTERSRYAFAFHSFDRVFPIAFHGHILA